MDGAPPPSTGSKALDAAFAYFASDEHQEFLRRRAQRPKPEPIKGIGFINPRMRKTYGTYHGKP